MSHKARRRSSWKKRNKRRPGGLLGLIAAAICDVRSGNYSLRLIRRRQAINPPGFGRIRKGYP